jgi:hypothetical protein
MSDWAKRSIWAVHLDGTQCLILIDYMPNVIEINQILSCRAGGWGGVPPALTERLSIPAITMTRDR